MTEKGTLIFFCGKMGAGKSTHARRLANELKAMLISEDDWLAALYPTEIHDFSDYLKYSPRLKRILKPHIHSILLSGTSVVMDFPANTRNQRTWFLEIVSEHDIPHRLVCLVSSDEACLKRLVNRRIEQPDRARFDTEEVFRHVTSFFQPPSGDEGFNIDILDTEST